MSMLDPKFVRRLQKSNVQLISECFCPPGIAIMLVVAQGPVKIDGYVGLREIQKVDEPILPEDWHDSGSLTVTFIRASEPVFRLPGQEDEVTATFYGIMRDGHEILVAKVSPLRLANSTFKHDPDEWDARPMHEGWDAIFNAIDAALPRIEVIDKE